MAALTPTGDMTNAEEALRDLLAASSTFQAWVEAEDAAAAEARIYIDVEASPTRPCACVRFDDPADSRSRAVAGGSRQWFLGSGTLGVLFEAVVDDTLDDPADQMRAFKRTIDQVLSDMQALSGSGGYLIVNTFRMQEGPFRTGPTGALANDDVLQALVAVDYGLEGSA